MININNCYNTGLNSFMKWDIGTVLRTMLLQDADIVSKVGSDVYPLVAPENTIGDFIIYSREKYSKETVKQGVYEDVCTMAFTVISDNYDRAISLAKAVDLVLTGKHEDEEGRRFEVMLTNSSERFVDEKYLETLIFEIK